MRRSSKAIAAIISAAAAGTLCASTAHAQVNWSPGVTGDFGATSSWQGGVVPGAGQQANVSQGTATISNGESFTVSEIWAGFENPGEVDQSGGTLTSTGWVVVGRGVTGSTTGIYNFSGGVINQSGGEVQLVGLTSAGTGATVMYISGNATLNNSGTFDIGDNAATVVQSGGTVNSTGQFWIGQSGQGVYNFSGGAINSTNWAVIGRGGGTGVLNMTGGILTHSATSSGDFEVGSGGNATLNLNGGTLITNYIRDENNSSETATINFDGGVIQANNSDSGYIGGHMSGSDVFKLNVQNNGAIFNTSGFNIGITEALVHGTDTNATDGGLTKIGAGTMTLTATNTYTGPTLISAGTLNLSGGITSTSNFTVGTGTNVNLIIGNLTGYVSTGSSKGLIASTGGLNISGGTFNYSVGVATGGLAVGQKFNLIGYQSGMEVGTAPAFNLVGSLPARAIGTVSDNTAAGEIQLTINSTDFLVWTGADTSSWDTTTGNVSSGATASMANWKLNSTGGNAIYIDNPGDTVVFDDTASNYNVTVGTATLHPNAVTFNNNSSTYTLTGTGGIGGLTGVTKSGTGIVNLDTSNTYTGPTLVQAGTLVIGTGGSLTGTTVTLGSGGVSGVLQVGDGNGSGTPTVSAVTVSGSGNANAVVNGNPGGTSTFTVSNTSPAVDTYSGFIGSGVAGSSVANNLILKKTGTGTLALTSANTYNGGTIFNAGTLNVSNNLALGTGTVTFTGNATLQAGASTVALGNAFVLGSTSDTFDTNGNTLTLNGAISNTQADVNVIQPIGTGTLVLGGTLSVFGGNNDTNNQAIYLAVNGTTATITGTGAISGISMAWHNTSNTLNLNPAGTLNFTNSDTSLDVGQQGGNGAVFQTGGAIAMAGNIYLGKWDGSYGSYTMAAGTLNVADFYSGGGGNGNGNSYYQQSGGVVTVGGSTTLGQGGAGYNTLYLQGGTYNNSGNAVTLANGGGSTATLTVAGGVLNASGQVIALAGNNSNTSNSVLNLNGGLTTAYSVLPKNSQSFSYVNFNGGTLQASSNSGIFMNGLTGAYLYSGGATIESNGQSINIGQNLQTAGGSNGLNTAFSLSSGGSGYVGAPVVNITGGGGTGATAVATVSGGQVTGVVITSAGTGYSSAPNFTFYGGGGSGAAVNTGAYVPTANAADIGLTKVGLGTLTLSGSNSYTGNTQVNAGTLAIANSNALSTGTALLGNHTTLAMQVLQPSVSFTGFYQNTNGYVPQILSGGNTVNLTSAVNNIATSVFSPTQYAFSDSTGFIANFTYNHLRSGTQGSVADGLTFTIENQSANATSSPGGDLGYFADPPNNNPGIQGSVASVINLYSDELETGINGAVVNTSVPGNPNMTSAAVGTNTNFSIGVNTVPLISQSVSSNVTIVYNGPAQTLTETITNNANGASYTLVTTGLDLVNVLQNAGGFSNTAYIGFTGATGGLNDVQSVTNFAFNNNGTTLTGGSITNAVTVSPASSSTVQLAPSTNFSSAGVGPITIGSGGTLAVANNSLGGATHGVLTTPSVTFSNSSSGNLDVANNALDITGQSLAIVNGLVKTAYSNGNWTGPGITSSVAANDTTHLTAVGVISNTENSTQLYGSGTMLGLFDGASPAATDVLVKYTYYGDTNLDGKVDGSDYSNIDNGFLNHLTGWYNGDFNYDGVVDGSDYTLIDNAFNTQGASLAGQVATATAQIAGTSAVPEPTSLGLLAIGAAGLLGRRRRKSSRHH